MAQSLTTKWIKQRRATGAIVTKDEVFFQASLRPPVSIHLCSSFQQLLQSASSTATQSIQRWNFFKQARGHQFQPLFFQKIAVALLLCLFGVLCASVRKEGKKCWVRWGM